MSTSGDSQLSRAQRSEERRKKMAEMDAAISLMGIDATRRSGGGGNGNGGARRGGMATGQPSAGAGPSELQLHGWYHLFFIFFLTGCMV